jgi:hypothetical protein
LIFPCKRTFVGVLFSQVLSISLFDWCSLEMRHVSLDSIAIIRNQQQRAEENPHGVIHSTYQQCSALMYGQGLLVIVW